MDKIDATSSSSTPDGEATRYAQHIGDFFMWRHGLAAGLAALLLTSTSGRGEAVGPLAGPALAPARPILIRVADVEHQRVAEAQLRLRALGLYHGTTNGTLGPQTRSALAEYQRRSNFPATGQLDERTAYALRNNDLLELCAARGVAVADCLAAIRQFHATFPEPGGAAPAPTGGIAARQACEGEQDFSDCASAVADMSAWLSARSGLQR